MFLVPCIKLTTTTVIAFDISILHLHKQGTDKFKNVDFDECSVCPSSARAGQPVLAFNQHFMSPQPQPAWSPEVMKSVIEGLGFSKDSSWLPALSAPSIPVFTF